MTASLRSAVFRKYINVPIWMSRFSRNFWLAMHTQRCWQHDGTVLTTRWHRVDKTLATLTGNALTFNSQRYGNNNKIVLPSPELVTNEVPKKIGNTLQSCQHHQYRTRTHAVGYSKKAGNANYEWPVGRGGKMRAKKMEEPNEIIIWLNQWF